MGRYMGAPLDADLAAAPTGAVPRFLVRALHDPNGANLDRIQIVKGWLMPTELPRKRCSTWPAAGETYWRPAATGRLAPRCTPRARHGETRSVRLPLADIGRTRPSIPRTAPSTPSACPRSRRRAERPMVPRSSAPRSPKALRSRSRNAPTPRRSVRAIGFAGRARCAATNVVKGL